MTTRQTKRTMQFLTVNDGETSYYGGAQAWLPTKNSRRGGCGPIALTNMLLSMEAADGRRSFELSRKEFLEAEQKMAGQIWIVPRFGVNGLALARRFNIYCRSHGLPFKARWGTRPSRIEPEITRMLEENVPVLLGIGPTFPLYFSKTKLTFYRKTGETYTPAVTTKAHFVTVTELAPGWMTISSWGRQYYIKLEEFYHFMCRKSIPLITNILIVKRKKR